MLRICCAQGSKLFYFLLDAACKKSRDNLWWHSRTISWPCGTFPHWRKGTCWLGTSYVRISLCCELGEVNPWSYCSNQLCLVIYYRLELKINISPLVGFHSTLVCRYNLMLLKDCLRPVFPLLLAIFSPITIY